MDISTALADAQAATLSAVPPEATDLEEVPTDAPVDEPTLAEPDAPAETETPEEEAVALPDGYVAVPTVTEGLATEFVLKDAQGEVEVPELVVEYKANGKVRQDRLDQVVKLAQFGVYNEAREQQYKEMDTLAESLIEERDVLSQRLQQLEAQFEKVLQDENFFYTVKEAYEVESSPEKRAERAEQRAEQAQIQAQLAPIVQQAEVFFSNEVTPALGLIAQTFPSVTADELAARMAYAMQLHVETAPNGQQYVPPSQYDAVRQYIMDDLSFWAQAQHARRSASTPAPDAALTAELAKAQVSAQKAKRAVGQATKPVGRAGVSSMKSVKAAPPSTVDDALDSAMSEILASFR
jgi:hypothetical protein